MNIIINKNITDNNLKVVNNLKVSRSISSNFNANKHVYNKHV